MTVLLLGGTFEAKDIARNFMAKKVKFVYSIAGIVRTPDLDCKIITGGFSQYSPDSNSQEGLEKYISDNAITAIVDATHPFAAYMSDTAAMVAKKQHLPIWRYYRPAWQIGGNWQEVSHKEDILQLITYSKRPFFTIGQQSYSLLKGKRPGQHWIIRSALKYTPGDGLEEEKDVTHISAIGPFKYDQEYQLLKQTRADILICKNSGGNAARAKLDAARELGIPVILLKRPRKSALKNEFCSPDECLVDFHRWWSAKALET